MQYVVLMRMLRNEATGNDLPHTVPLACMHAFSVQGRLLQTVFLKVQHLLSLFIINVERLSNTTFKQSDTKKVRQASEIFDAD